MTDFDSRLKDQLAKLDEQFDEIHQELKAKKEAFIEMYRKDLRVSQDWAVSTLKKIIQNFDPLNHQEISELAVVETIEAPTHNETLGVNETSVNVDNEAVIVCQSFSDDYFDIDVSSCKQIVKFTDEQEYGFGYCFLNHPTIKKDQVLQWTVRVPKFYFLCEIGIGYS